MKKSFIAVSTLFALLIGGLFNSIVSNANESTTEKTSSIQLLTSPTTRTSWKRVLIRERYYLYNNGSIFIFDIDFIYISDDVYRRGSDSYLIETVPAI